MIHPYYYLGPYLVTDRFEHTKREDTYQKISHFLLPISYIDGYDRLSQCEIWIPNRDDGFIRFDEIIPDEVGIEFSSSKISRQINRFQEFYANALKTIEPQTGIFHVTFGLVSYYA